jgi:hypothetical protein
MRAYLLAFRRRESWAGGVLRVGEIEMGDDFPSHRIVSLAAPDAQDELHVFEKLVLTSGYTHSSTISSEEMGAPLRSI